MLTVREVAEILQVHPNHVRRLISNKKIKHSKIPGVGIRFYLKDIERMVEESVIEVVDWDSKAQELTRG